MNEHGMILGIDLGDRDNHFCALDSTGNGGQAAGYG